METTQATLNLVKDQKVDITKDHPGLTTVSLGMGWDQNAGNGPQFDLDASAICCGADKKPLTGDAVCYFGRLNIPGVKHSGDNRTGAGDGDDETITVDFSQLPAGCESIYFVANIYNAPGVTFGAVKNTHIRIYDVRTPSQDLAKFDPSEDYSNYNALVFGKLYKHNGEWKFQALGQGKTAADLNVLLASFPLD